MVTTTEACPGPLTIPLIVSTAPAIVAIDDGGAVAPGAAALCSACGTAEISCVNADLALVPAAVPTPWLTTAAWPASPAGLVVCGASMNGANWVATAADFA